VHPRPSRPAVPIGFAHRGARAERRENTIAAFIRALELGASGLESDAWITADGEVVIDHDGVTGPPWRRRAVSVSSRTALPAHIPSLAELYDACGTDFELSLDVKDPGALAPLLDVAAAADATARLWLCHPDRQLMAGWREMASGATGASPPRLVQSTHLADISEGLEDRSRTLRQSGIDALNLHGSEWTPQRLAAVHDAGLLAFGWDAQSRLHVARLLHMGLDGVYSDHVGVMMSEIARLER
jgi:glycerophosphoryl diester phosphodiesterase